MAWLRFSRASGALALALWLAACATPRPPPPASTTLEPTTSAPPYRTSQTPATPPVATPFRAAPVHLADLPGWEREDHAGALLAFQQGCVASHAPSLTDLCRRARALGPVNEDQARGFLETHFRAQPVGPPGLLTAYYAPEYEARPSRHGEFTAPVRAKPADLIVIDLGAFDPTLAGRKLDARLVGGQLTPYYDRSVIEAQPPETALAWMRPEDLFFLQIQGSGVLRLPDGRRLKASFVASNGRPFVGIANILRDRGALAPDDTSAEAIHAWLADHRGPQADEVMRQNPRYVFFKLGPDDGIEPTGAAGLPLVPGRSLAVDPTRHALGGLYWIDASSPSLNGAFPIYRRLAMALDTGGAIKGDVRADLYMGRGAAAGREAGRVRHALNLYALEPFDSEPYSP